MSPKTKKIINNVEAKTRVTLVFIMLLLVSIMGVFMYNNQTASGAAFADFNYYKAITLDHNQIPSSQVDFPVLINLTADAQLASNALDNGNDIAFFASDQNTQLNHEIELFNGANGQLVAWVNVTTMHSSVDTTIYMAYGDSDIGSSAENIEGVWNTTKYLMVHHMDGEDNTTMLDSTSNNHDVDDSSGTPGYETTSIIGEAVTFDKASDEYFTIPASDDIEPKDLDWGFSCWFKTDGDNSNHCVIYGGSGDGALSGQWLQIAVRSSTGYMDTTYDDDAGLMKLWSEPTSYSDNTWHYLFTTRDNADNTVYQYVDNVLKNSTADAGNTIEWDNKAAIGAYHSVGDGTYSNPFDGILDEVRITKTGLDADWHTIEYNNMVNATDGGFFTLGAQAGDTDASLDMGDSPNSYFTTSGERGNSYYANATGDYDETANLTVIVDTAFPEWLRINVSDIHANITADLINISFDDNNVTWSGNWHSCTAGGESIIVNGSNWDTNNWMSGNNPFTADGDGDGYNEIQSTTSIYWRVRVTYPGDIGNETYSKLDMTWDGGIYD